MRWHTLALTLENTMSTAMLLSLPPWMPVSRHSFANLAPSSSALPPCHGIERCQPVAAWGAGNDHNATSTAFAAPDDPNWLDMSASCSTMPMLVLQIAFPRYCNAETWAVCGYASALMRKWRMQCCRATLRYCDKPELCPTLGLRALLPPVPKLAKDMNTSATSSSVAGCTSHG